MKKKYSNRSCPICSSRDESNIFAEENFDPKLLNDFSFASRKTPELMHHRLVLCPTCDVLYSNPIPASKTISKAYQEAAFDSSEEARYAAHTYAKFLPTIKNNIPSVKGALDIGTGDGAFLSELLDHEFTGVMGVEPSLAPIKAASPKIRPLIKHTLFKPANFKKNSLGLVTCFQTFEHLLEPMVMCEGIYKILGEGGAFFGVFHNHRSLSAKILGLKSPIFDIEHMQLFTPTSAKFMMARAGFKRVEVRTIYNTYPLHYWLKVLPIPLKIKKMIIQILKKIGIGFIPIPLPAGNMAVIGYK
jgi:SAM-dependent methyltransferase